ncbi:YwhD family protein [Gorillibacterium sp. sgz5001074]|uniref:YwhD family protein n=1 Tax=Gorillibacterium sp. sgz5001074 TaxID=3446695 RepID=UPI003F674606
MEIESKGKKPNALNIVSSSVNHKGFGAGSIDLSNVSGVIIDEGVAYVDNGTLHAKSKVEKGIKFSPDPSETPDGRKVWVVWVAVDRNAEGQFYGGLAACEMRVNPEARRGWKVLADHVNRMDKAMKRHILVEGLDDSEKAALKKLLMEHNPEWWAHSPEELKQAL